MSSTREAVRTWVLDRPAWRATWHVVGLPQDVYDALPPILEGADGITVAEATAHLESLGVLEDGRPDRLLATAVTVATTAPLRIDVVRRDHTGITQAVLGAEGPASAGVMVRTEQHPLITVLAGHPADLLDMAVDAAGLDPDDTRIFPSAENLDITRLLDGRNVSADLADALGLDGSASPYILLTVSHGDVVGRAMLLDTVQGLVTLDRQGTDVRSRPTTVPRLRNWMMELLASGVIEAGEG